jgi:glycosyltransferase involved in cell wall biosynthesis
MIGGKTISAFVITLNEERNIAECLESIKWADEIMVVDSYSEDRTLEIASRYTSRIIQRQFAGYVAQTSYALEQTTCPWVLWLDADEHLTPEALAEIRGVFEGPGEPRDRGFAFPRKTFFMGRWIMHSGWYPQRKVRLFHRDCGRVEGEEPHVHVSLDGPVMNMRGDILHHSYPGGLAEMVGTSTNYAALAARARYAAGGRFSLASLLVKPPGTFLKKYLLQMGLLDGFPGLTIAAGAAYYRFMREAMLWELQQAGSQNVGGDAA